MSNTFFGRLSDSGGWITQELVPFDCHIVARELGKQSPDWYQQATPQDNYYFGYFINLKQMTTVTFVEGDLITTRHVNNHWFHRELHKADKFYLNC